MMHRDKIREYGMSKLAEGVLPYYNYPDPEPNEYGYIQREPVAMPSAVVRNQFTAPSEKEMGALNNYMKAMWLGALAGGTLGTGMGALFKGRRAATMPLGAALGAAIGAGSGMLRHYDQSADPPGLSPIYTVPAGLRLGALAGGAIGGVAGAKLKGLGMLKGLLGGAVAGSAGGGIVSGMV